MAKRQAMILAAGLGTRMRHLTEDRPKALVEVAGKPLIAHVIDQLRAAKIDSLIVNLHAHADRLEKWLLGQDLGLEILISDERDLLLNTGGAISNALPLVKDTSQPLLIANVDSLWTEKTSGQNLQALYEGWNGESDDVRMLLADPANCLGYSGAGDFDQGAFERAIRRHAAEHYDYVYAGVQLIKPALFENLPAKPFSVWQAWQPALDVSRVSCHILEGFWLHVGTPLAVKNANAHLETRETVG